MRRPRHLSAEERALWDHVTRRDKPARKPALPLAPIQPDPPKPVVVAVPRLRPFAIGQQVDHRRSNDLLPALSDRLARAPVQMDAKAFGKLKRGKLVPEGRIDLHGMTQRPLYLTRR